MMNLNSVKQLDKNIYQVVDKTLGIDAKVDMNFDWRPEVKGKGSRKNYDAIVDLVKQFIKDKKEREFTFDPEKIKEVSSSEAKQIINACKPLGKFYTIEKQQYCKGDGTTYTTDVYLSIDNEYGESYVQEFDLLIDCINSLK